MGQHKRQLSNASLGQNHLANSLELSLSLLQSSRTNPKLLAWEQLHGCYHFNCTPIAPPQNQSPGTFQPDQRGTWAYRAAKGQYTGPALEHYQCYMVWIKSSWQERIVNQLTWFHHKIAPTDHHQDRPNPSHTNRTWYAPHQP